MSQCLNPVCGKSNLVGEKFCSKCGSKLLLADRYRATEFLGQGGFGRTFKAMDEYRLQTRCVIKQFLPLHHGSKALKKSKELFEQEAIQLCALGKHPQIPDLLAFFEQEGKLYLIQDLIEGEDLLKELRSKGFYNEAKTRDFLVQLLPVLQFIHEKNVIHRDIKPENIIRRKNKLDPAIYGQMSDLVLIDFGVSKQVSATVMTRLGTGIGTPGYAAPEQSRGMVHFSSDLYSLAITAIRLLTGVFPEERNGSVIDEIFDLYNLSWIWKEWLGKNGLSISKDLAQVLDKMIADRVNDRFQSAREVLEALQTPLTPPSKAKPPLTPPSQGGGSTPLSLIRRGVGGEVNFTQLDRLLSQGKWKEADQETGKVMCKIMGREKEGYLTDDNCKNFPKEELKIIDQLWVKYSNGKFGFSVQKKIWIACGGTPGVYNYDVYKKFADTVGWRKGGNWLSYSDLTFNTNVPFNGHLPFGLWWVGFSLSWVGYLFSLV
jgi:serine/threonine protein kinase